MKRRSFLKLIGLSLLAPSLPVRALAQTVPPSLPEFVPIEWYTYYETVVLNEDWMCNLDINAIGDSFDQDRLPVER